MCELIIYKTVINIIYTFGCRAGLAVLKLWSTQTKRQENMSHLNRSYEKMLEDNREAGRSSGMVSAGGVMLGPESSPLDFHQLLWVVLISSALDTAGNRSRIPWNCWKSHINIKAVILKSKTKRTKSRELLNQA